MYCVIDFETTGLSPHESDIIEYAAVRVEDDRAGGLTVGEVFTSLCAPARTLVSPTITRITGITPAMVEGLPPFERSLRDFLDFIGGDTVVAHNIPFDMGFLRRYCGDAGIRPPPKTLCTLVLSRRMCRLRSHKLEDVARALGVDSAGYHRALADAVTTAKILIRLLEMRLS
ncbi:MAG: 3'-5' exonuclease [Oscillospiraceae bacterium]|jgi:DNA polymerase III epsilon subunit family exonuclease|nr:3'-5' exonuclease [Oscillospiraceae bacterium]